MDSLARRSTGLLLEVRRAAGAPVTGDSVGHGDPACIRPDHRKRLRICADAVPAPRVRRSRACHEERPPPTSERIERSLHAGTLGRCSSPPPSATGWRCASRATARSTSGPIASSACAPARLAAGLVGLGIAPGDRVALFSDDAPGVDAGRLRRPLRRRDRRADLPHELARGVPTTCSRTPGARAVIVRGRRAARQDRAGPRRAARRSSTSSLIDGRPRARCRSPSSRARGADGRRAPSTASGVGRARRRGDDRLHVGHHRPAEGLHAHPRATCSRRSDAYERAPRPRRRRRDLPVPAAGPLARARHPARRARRGRHAGLLERRPDSARSTTSPTTRPTHVPSVPRVFEKIHTRALARGRGRRRGSSGAIFALGARDRPARPRGRSARAGVGPALRAAPRGRPTGSCCRRSARCSAADFDARADRRRADRAARCSSSSTPAACSCSRATA